METINKFFTEPEIYGAIMGYIFMGLGCIAFLEFLYLQLAKKFGRVREYVQMSINTIFGIGLAAVLNVLIGLAGKYTFVVLGLNFAFFETDLSWYWWIYGLLVYEFFYWLMHFLAHKVRLFWCIHSSHHAPESMHFLVGFNHFFIEAIIYLPFFLGFFPAVFGVHPVIILTIALVDITWGNFLHISDRILPGKLGFLERFLQTPTWHRVHHAQNVKYMDTNYTSLTLFWDWIFGTLQALEDNDPVVFGITREVDTNSFWDVQFGEFPLLWQDIKSAPTFKDKLLYLLKPPGWNHTGEGKTSADLKKELGL